jgi:hypothetical protein
MTVLCGDSLPLINPSKMLVNTSILLRWQGLARQPLSPREFCTRLCLKTKPATDPDWLVAGDLESTKRESA